MSRMRNAVVAAAVATIAVAGCAAGVSPAPDLGGLYNRAAQAEDATRNPVIVIPGIVHLFAGDAKPTAARLTVDPISGKVAVREQGPGDGTVLRTSALLDERVGQTWVPGLASPLTWSSITFLFSDHLALTQDLGFADNLLFRLLDSPRPAAPGHAARTQP